MNIFDSLEEHSRKYKKEKERKQLISNLEGCLGPILLIGGPLLLIIGCHYVAETDIGQNIMNTWMVLWLVIYGVMALLVIFGLGSVVYYTAKSKIGSPELSLLLSIIVVTIFILIMCNLPGSCSHINIDHAHYDKF